MMKANEEIAVVLHTFDKFFNLVKFIAFNNIH